MSKHTPSRAILQIRSRADNGARKRDGIFYDAINVGDMEKLLHPETTELAANAPALLTAAERSKMRYDHITFVTEHWNLSWDSAKTIIDNPWVEPWLTKVKNIPSVNINVSNVAPDQQGGLRLRIRLKTKNRRDYCDIRVQESGKVDVVLVPLTDALDKILKERIVPSGTPLRNIPSWLKTAPDKLDLK